MLGLLVLLLTGCLFRPPDELYQRPQKSPGYEQLTVAIQQVRSGLESKYSSSAEDAVIAFGDNTATIQLQDLDSDGVRESAVVFLRLPGAEKPMKIFIFTQNQETEEYRVSAVVEGDGSAIYSVDYADLNGTGLNELVVSWQISTGVYQLGAYTLDELNENISFGSGSTSESDWERLRATEILLTGATVPTGSSSRSYILLDIDQDTRKEIALARMDSAGETSQVEVYGWRDGAFVCLDKAPLSKGAVSLVRMKENYLSGKLMTPALYITTALADGSQAIDVMAYQHVRTGDGRMDWTFTNISVSGDTGISRTVLPPSMDIAPAYVNDDIVLELPSPMVLPAYGDSRASYWIIDWGQYSESGDYSQVLTTYHNFADGWYLEIPDSWIGQLTISRNDTLSGQRQVDFSLWHGEEKEPETFLSIYQLTGSNRTIRAASGGRIILREEGETIYAAKLYDISWDCGLDEESLTGAFHLIQTSWNS